MENTPRITKSLPQFVEFSSFFLGSVKFGLKLSLAEFGSARPCGRAGQRRGRRSGGAAAWCGGGGRLRGGAGGWSGRLQLELCAEKRGRRLREKEEEKKEKKRKGRKEKKEEGEKRSACEDEGE
jgi:hypothetical protein